MNRANDETKRKARSTTALAKSHRARQPSLIESHTLDPAVKPQMKREWKRISGRTHGGLLARGKRKESRPLNRKKWLHLILKSSKASGRYSFLTPAHQMFIDQLIEKKARKFGVKIHSRANFGHHLHLKLKFENRSMFQNFLRSITAQIARKVTGARKGKPFRRFWDAPAYTRIVTKRHEELQLCGYIEGSKIEGSISKAAREIYLAKFNAWVQSLTGE